MRGAWRLRNLKSDTIRWHAMRRALRNDRAFPRFARKAPHGLPGPLIVSVTSFPARFPTLHLCLRSLLDQSVAADLTVLWIAEEDRCGLPVEVTELEKHGLAIRCCEDIRSYKKLVPALREFPEAHVVTADDDLYFAGDWLRELVDGARAHLGSVIAHRAHIAVTDSTGAFLPYSEWEFETREITDRSFAALIFPTNGAGTLYPPKSLDKVVTDQDLFTRLCPLADDVWFFWMARLAGTPERTIRSGRKLLWWDGSQEVGLFHENLWGQGNDAQIRAMEAHFGRLGPEVPDEQQTKSNLSV